MVCATCGASGSVVGFVCGGEWVVHGHVRVGSKEIYKLTETRQQDEACTLLLRPLVFYCSCSSTRTPRFPVPSSDTLSMCFVSLRCPLVMSPSLRTFIHIHLLTSDTLDVHCATSPVQCTARARGRGYARRPRARAERSPCGPRQRNV